AVLSLQHRELHPDTSQREAPHALVSVARTTADDFPGGSGQIWERTCRRRYANRSWEIVADLGEELHLARLRHTAARRDPLAQNTLREQVREPGRQPEVRPVLRLQVVLEAKPEYGPFWVAHVLWFQ